MIRFCDKQIYKIHIGEMTAEQMRAYFSVEEHRSEVILIYDKEDNYYGMVTYQRVTNCKQDDLVNKEMLEANEFFWDRANAFFMDHLGEFLPVVDKEKKVLGFAYSDEMNYYFEKFFKAFEEAEEIPVSLFALNRNCRQICIHDFNEMAWKCYQLFKKLGYPVCVFGEKWKWFGIEVLEGYNDYPDYARLTIFAETTKRFKRRIDNRDDMKIWVGNGFDFLYDWMDISLKSIYGKLVKEWLNKGISVCRCVFPTMEEVQYWTDDESIGRFYGVGAAPYVVDPTKYTSRRREVLENLIEADVMQDLEEWHQRGDIEKRQMPETWQPVMLGFKMDVEKLKNTFQNRRIYMIGPCIVGGELTKQDYTFPVNVQKLVDELGYMVVKIPWGRDTIMGKVADLANLPISEDDIIICCEERKILGGLDGEEVDVTELYNTPGRKNYFDSDWVLHTTKHGNEAFAKHLFTKYLKNEIEQKKKVSKNNAFICVGDVLSEEYQKQIVEQFKKIKVSVDEKKVGAVVMNCNPFTYGHQYLVEYAARQVDVLYVFVVEENRSQFDFTDRIEMVKEGTKHLENVIVTSSGNWIASYQTYPIYFERGYTKVAKADAELDLEIFARYIARELNISIRFVGEEPKDLVTRQYNEQMKYILGRFGIKVDEIPRKKIGEEVYSASAVREFIKEGNWEKVREYVPESTYRYLKK